MATSGMDHLRQLDDLLSTGNQSWLFGAGISLEAGLPLMFSLTNRVVDLANAEGAKAHGSILKLVQQQLPEECHIEHVLSHLCDLISLADRAAQNTIRIGDQNIECTHLRELHEAILTWIAETVRWGYVPKSKGIPERIGSREVPIVTVDSHLAFVRAIFGTSQAGISERRKPVRFFTLNYDTLLEDALSLSCISYWDGISGGALGYRHYHYGDREPDSGFRALLVKLHGSIDWHLSDDDKVWRLRDGDTYPVRNTRVLIYPQATKYLATQRDPFAGQFDLFRRTLRSTSDSVLSVCGYSFGDEHINQEIELAMRHPDNKSTLVVFAPNVPSVVSQWQREHWGKRIYTVASDGLYVGSEGPFAGPANGHPPREWWTFSGATKLVSNGSEACIL